MFTSDDYFNVTNARVLNENVNHLDERKYEPDEKLPSGKTPAQKMERKRGQHGARVKLGNPALGRSARNDPESDSYRERAFTMDVVKSAQEKGEEPSKDPGWKNLIKARRRPRASYEKPNERSGGLRAKETKAGGHRTLVRKEEFDVIAEYIFVEGYADTIESAELIAESISEQWVNEILDEKYVRALDTTGKGADHRTRFPKFHTWDKDPEVSPQFTRRRARTNDKKIDPYFSGRKERKDKKREGVGGFREMREYLDTIIEYLFTEGYVDSYEEAEYILEDMSYEEFEDLLESSGMTQGNRKTLERLVGQHGKEFFTNPKTTKSARKREPEPEPQTRKPTTDLSKVKIR